MSWFFSVWFVAPSFLCFSWLDSVVKEKQKSYKMKTFNLCSSLRTWRQQTMTRQHPPMTPCWCLTMKVVALTQEASPLWTHRAVETRTMTASMNGDLVSKNWPTCTEEEMTCCKCTKDLDRWMQAWLFDCSGSDWCKIDNTVMSSRHQAHIYFCHVDSGLPFCSVGLAVISHSW